MSEQEVMTPEEARDLARKLDAFAQELSPKQRDFVSAMLRSGAASAEVQGYGYGYTPPTSAGMYNPEPWGYTVIFLGCPTMPNTSCFADATCGCTQLFC